jgi:hypothetical protein
MEKYQDKILLGLALLVLGGAFAFTQWEKKHLASSKGQSTVAANAAYQPVAEKAPELNAKPATWSDPQPQKEPGETFEVATNPWIYVDKIAGTVTFKAPQAKGVRTTPDVALQFVGLREDDYPLQIALLSGISCADPEPGAVASGLEQAGSALRRTRRHGAAGERYSHTAAGERYRSDSRDAPGDESLC